MKPYVKEAIKCIAVIAIVFTFIISLLFGPFIYGEFRALAVMKELRSWTKEDCSIVWNEAKILSAKHGDGKDVEDDDIPKPLRRAGFKSATVSSSEFYARHGGQSFGSAGGFVRCYFNGIEGSEPFMRYNGGHYYPDGRLEPFR
ncbi:hypothetical protein OAF27_01135 [Verrucomicrobiales bacterium]|nr:hypothetical protein [Verrucomicrobiales bacterium]